MAEQPNTEKQSAPRPKRPLSIFLKSLLGTTIPITVLGAISGGTRIAGVHQVAFSAIGIIAIGLWVLAILASIGFAIARKRQIAAGMLAGAAIGLVGLGLSCFGSSS